MKIENFENWKKLMTDQKVILFLPRFRITWGSFSLVKALQSLGMVDAFSSTRADFSGMDGRSDWLYITDVLHKAFVDVNEEGTEAAAATAVVVGARSVAAPPVVFRADRPFLFIIQENSTGSILFMGRVNEPEK
jgi:serpin B